MAGLGWLVIGRETALSVLRSLREGRGLAEGLYDTFRFFTMSTNLFVAGLMTATLWCLLRRRPMPPAGFYAAALVYALVMSATYEILLRGLWSPQGLQFATDMVLHDVLPALMLLFWIVSAPKAPLRWRDPLRWLEYPALYFLATELAGLVGADYPYDFLDVDKLGSGGVGLVALAFLGCFYVLGLVLVAVARRQAAARVRTAG